MRKEKDIKLSLCMIVRDEEAFLSRCLNSVKPIVDEIVIVDTGSRDNTVKIAEGFRAKIIRTKWEWDYSRPRNISLQEAKGDWILVLDADQTIANQDLSKIKPLLKRKEVFGFRFPERDYCNDYNLLRDWQICSGEYESEEELAGCRGYASISLIHLFQNKKDIYYGSCAVHSSVDDSIARIDGRIEDARIAVHHFQCLKGADYVRIKQLRQLKDCMKISLKNYRYNPSVYYNIAIGLFTYKRDDCKAARFVKGAIELNPSFRDAYNLLGMIYLEQQKYDKSLPPLLKSLSIDSACSDTHCLLGIAYDGEGKIDGAIRHFKRSLQLKPFHPFAYNSLGVCYVKKGLYNDALRQFRTAVEILPEFKIAYKNINLLRKRRHGSLN